MERAVGLIFVVALHAAALWGLWQHRLIPAPREALTLFVDFIAPPAPRVPEEPRKPLPPKPVEKSKPIIVATSSVVSPTDPVVPQPPPPVPVPPAIQAPPPAGPIALTTELAVACPDRSPPAYPAMSRRLDEEGTVVLQVELDESGLVAIVKVHKSSGFARLDEAALSAVRTWRCTPAQRNGTPVRATALQPFRFVLQGS